VEHGPWDETPLATTPLMWTTALGEKGMVSLLLNHGGDASLRDWEGRTAADYGAKRPNVEH